MEINRSNHVVNEILFLAMGILPRLNLSNKKLKNIIVNSLNRRNIRSLLTRTLIFSALSIGTIGIAQTKKSYLLALSKNDHTLAVVDPATLKVLFKVPVGADPHEVVASEDGKFAYVSITGGGLSTEIDVIDLVAQKSLTPINTKPLLGPHGLMEANGKVWFSAEGSKAIGRIDQSTNTVDWVIGTGEDRTHMVYVMSDAKQLYTTNVNAGSVSILVDTLMPPPSFPNEPAKKGEKLPSPPPFPGGGQPRREWLHKVIKLSKGVEGFDVSPNGKQLWAASADDGAIFVIDLVSRKLLKTIDAKANGANRLKFTPDGNYALVSSLRSGDFMIYDVSTYKEIKRINLGKGAAGIQVEPNGNRAFIGCTPDNYVAIVDLKKLEVIGHIDVGAGPDGLAWLTRN